MKITNRFSSLELQSRIVLTVVYYFILFLPILPVFFIGDWGPPLFIPRMAVVRIVADGDQLYARSIEIRVLSRYSQAIHVSRDLGSTWNKHAETRGGRWIDLDSGWDWNSEKNPTEAKLPRGLDEDVLSNRWPSAHRALR